MDLASTCYKKNADIRAWDWHMNKWTSSKRTKLSNSMPKLKYESYILGAKIGFGYKA